HAEFPGGTKRPRRRSRKRLKPWERSSGSESLERRTWQTRLSERSWTPTSEGSVGGGRCKKSVTAAWRGSVDLRSRVHERERNRAARPRVGGNEGVDNVIRIEGGSPGGHQVFPFGSRI